MIERTGRIVSIVAGVATIRVETPAACTRCGSRTVCGDSGKSVHVPVVAALRAGDEVSLHIESGLLVRGALFAYFLPAAALLGGAVLLSPWGDLAAIAGACGGLGIGLITQRIRSRCRPAPLLAVAPVPNKDFPSVTPKLNSSPLGELS